MLLLVEDDEDEDEDEDNEDNEDNDSSDDNEDNEDNDDDEDEDPRILVLLHDGDDLAEESLLFFFFPLPFP